VAERKSVAAKELYAFLGFGANLIYNAAKPVAIGLGIEPKLRSTKNIPVNPPGRLVWGTWGAEHGKMDIGTRHGMPPCLLTRLPPHPDSAQKVTSQ